MKMFGPRDAAPGSHLPSPSRGQRPQQSVVKVVARWRKRAFREIRILAVCDVDRRQESNKSHCGLWAMPVMTSQPELGKNQIYMRLSRITVDSVTANQAAARRSSMVVMTVCLV